MSYLTPERGAVAELLARDIEGDILMLNLLRFRDVADYSDHPQLAPSEPVSGRQAYRTYMRHAQPYLEAHGGRPKFLADGGRYLIGPEDARWDAVLLVRYPSVEAFMAFATDRDYLAGLGHRSAALEDSRLLPLVEADPYVFV